MRHCPITYEPLRTGRYSRRGLNLLSRTLEDLSDFPYSVQEQLEEARLRASKISLQGIQPKLSVTLSVRESTFVVVDRGGRYILKPQNPGWSQLPEVEDLTMRLAAEVGIEVPLHGLIYCKDGSMTYFIRRFDRTGRGKVAVEDFAQLAGLSRETKYDFSMERVAAILDEFCTFPLMEKLKLFRLTVFNFLCGNEDAHVKNFSLIRRNRKIELSPAYDLVNTTILLRNAKEELALPLVGKKSRLGRPDLLDSFARERLGLTEKAVAGVRQSFVRARSTWESLIDRSFLASSLRQRYREVVAERWDRLEFPRLST